MFHNKMFAIQYHYMKVSNSYWLKFFFSDDLFVCVEVLRHSQPNWVVPSAVSFT